MKKILVSCFILTYIFSLTACSSKLMEGTEKTYYGTVTDRGMSVVNEGDREGRSYIIISCDDETVLCFWLADACQNPAEINDSVKIESAIEKGTDLLIATSITVTEKTLQ